MIPHVLGTGDLTPLRHPTVVDANEDPGKAASAHRKDLVGQITLGRSQIDNEWCHQLWLNEIR